MNSDPDIKLPLDRCYHWEHARADELFLTQPIGSGAVRHYTWTQAMDEARRVAAFLKAQGYPHGARVAIMSKNCAHWVMSDIAIMMAGYVSVPLYPTLTAKSVRQILEHSEAVAVFAGKLDAWEEMLSGIPQGVQILSFPSSPENRFETWATIVSQVEPMAGQPQRQADELATIIYTSGTTGMPKGVMHHFAAMAASAMANIGLTEPTPKDRMLSYLPMAHVAERAGVEMGAVYAGFRLFFAESLDTFVEDLRRARPTVFFSVPRLWVKFQQGVSSRLPATRLERLLRIPVVNRLIRRKILRQLGLDRVRLAASGAAPLSRGVMNWYRNLGLELLEVYGMTEVFGLSHSCRSGDVRIGYVGSPLDTVQCRLSETGEILVHSPSNTMGYFKEPQQTAALFTEDGFICTGDRGLMDERGRLKITGRVKELFKTSKGKYIAPAPIEDRLTAHPDVEACCVCGANQPQPYALLMLSPEAVARCHDPAAKQSTTSSLENLLTAVNEQLDRHERLAFLVCVSDAWDVENGFVTPTLKIKRHAIEDAYGAGEADWYAARKSIIWQ